MNYKDIRRICSSVDLYEAIKKPVNPLGKWGAWARTGSYSSGLDNLVAQVDEIMDNELKSVSLTSADINYFFEFSILPSILDPESTEELECFSFLRGDTDFEKIFTPSGGTTTSIYENSITDMLSVKGISIFHHPNFLFDIWANASDPLTITDVTAKGKRVIAVRKDKAKTILMKRSYAESIDISKNFYSSPYFTSLYDIQKELHNDLISKVTNTENTFFISFPIVGAKSSNQLSQNIVCNRKDDMPIQGIGSFFLYIESNKISMPIIKKISESLFVAIGELGRLFSINYLFNLGLQLQENARRESIKSAISAIMSRNMSHNLGSHYLYYTKAYLEQLANNAGNIAPDIRGAAKVMGYIQARMDYLATVISNDKYPYGAVNFKSQIYDELTIDDFSHRHFFDDKNKRTTNFLLTNLIYSENFTRPDVRSDDDLKEKSNQLFLHVKLLEEDKKFANFTGTWHSSKLQWVRKEKKEKRSLPTMTTEETVKNQLSSLNIALPGGSMSCHALFNVIENFIRNSAKYLQNDINKEQGLICTIALSPNPLDNNYVEVTIYDNKMNANKIVDDKKGVSLYNQILEKLCSLVVIDEQNKISKEDKGFKEMLFSSIWMRAYTFGNNNTYADIVSKINSANNGEEKLSLIERHGFSLVRVAESQEGDIAIYDRRKNYDGECNLGLQLKLPLFKQCDEIIISGDKAKDVDNILNMMSDIVLINKDFLESDYHHVFTRPLLKDEASGLSMYERYHKVISNRFPDIDKHSLCLQKCEDNYNSTPQEFRIYFKRHMSTSGNADPNEYMGYAYADTVSGGNFTITLLDLFNKGYENGAYKTDEDRIFALKIKESALTKVTVIDERLFKSTHENDYPWLSLKNVRVLNYNDSFDDTIHQETNDDKYDISNIFIGNAFRDGSDVTHFLTIHLGLIEKILKNSTYVNNLINKRMGVDNDGESHRPLDPIRVKTFMRLLREKYSDGNIRNLYIAVHSGRGNYSAELEGPLSKYPFISLSALENAFNNSKYQLCQLLYNTVYIGKGFANNIK